MTVAEHRRTCPLCEAMCGVVLDVEGETVRGVRGDPDDVFSRGYVCPKAVALVDVHHDPDRLRRPLRRRGGDFEEVGWEEALGEASARLGAIQRAHGDDAVGLYLGNPTTHGYSIALASLELAKALATRNLFSTASVDHLPHMFAAYHAFGNKALLPVPDVDRTDFMLVLGSNPLVSNGSLMSAPGVRRRLEALRARGGRLVVVDPRRTRTAELADEHLAIRPGTDALLLLALLRTLFEGGLAVASGRLEGVEELRRAVQPFAPERVEAATGIAAGTIRRLARDFAASPSAVCYGRLGVCTQRFGGLCCWLMIALNALTGNLDRVGGAMFTTPAADLARLARLLGEAGSFGRFSSRVRGAPEFGGELPLAVLAEEIEAPGHGQVRGLVTVAGNPVLSAPNGKRLDAALGRLECLVAVDFYVNETTRHADLILPPVFALERDHYDLLLNALTVRNVARYCPPLFEPSEGGREDWRILLDLAVGVARRKRAPVAAARAAALRATTPRRVLDLLLRLGPYRTTVRRLEREGRTLDLGPLRPGRLGRRRVRLAPEPMLAGVAQVEAALEEAPRDGELLLIGRRQLRDHNSWLHNVPRLVRGRDRCTLVVHPADAGRRGLEDGGAARVRSRTGTLVAPVEVSDAIREGVVSLPHGWGHGRPGTRLGVAGAHAGVCVNDVTDDTLLDVSGTSALNGVAVTVEAHANDTR
ncbi:MAG: molybdopterin-dependent oxidoreductase [Thermoleophilia bacterium]|nr:molybdopterin-dependent oxidoreductase [Thermoleophilia bacterium]